MVEMIGCASEVSAVAESRLGLSESQDRRHWPTKHTAYCVREKLTQAEINF